MGTPPVSLEKLLEGYDAGEKLFRVHLDGYNMLDHLTGGAESPRHLFVYATDVGGVCGIRYDDWKVVYMEQRAKYMDIWRDPFVELSAPKIFTLRRDPFEKADTDSNDYDHWWLELSPNLAPVSMIATEFFKTFQKFPPRQEPQKWNLNEIMKRLQTQPNNS